MQFKSWSMLFAAAAVTSFAGAAVPALAATAPTGPSVSSSEMQAMPNLWFVQLKSTPAANGSNNSVIRSEQKAFRTAAASAGVKLKERHVFETLWNGFSIEATRSEIGKIKSIAGVTGVWPVAIIEAPPQGSSASPELFTALAMTGADIAQSELGLTGTGIKVAVMDTGIDVDHADFGGDGVARSDSPLFPSERIAYGFDFVGDDFNADPASPTFNPVASPDPNPDDCNGHGSHVAGIVGANGVVTGVAPDVTFGAYRVFGCEGSTTADIMIAAMEAALKDDMDVLNMSIGTPYNWPQYPTAVAASRLVDRGMVVVASIGNNGANGLYSASAPGLGEKVVGTAAFDNTAVTQATFSISPDGALVGYNPAAGAPVPPQSGSLDLVAATPATACPTLVNGHFVSPFTAGSLTGKAVLVDRGTCSFYWKARFAEEAGAAAVIIANNAAGPLNATVETSGGAAFTPIPCPHADFPTCPAIGVPTVGILQTSGSAIRTRLAGGPVQLTWTDQTLTTPSATGGLISSFSSYGLSPDLVLKPDIGAPGGNIWSTYPLDKGKYANISGTSMSSPHVAGAAALLLQAKPDTSAADVRTILQNSADPKAWFGNPGLGFLDNVHRQGAGMVDIDDSILATTVIRPGKISAGEGQAGPKTQVLTVSNAGDSPVTYDLSFVNALSTSGVIAPGFTTSNASVAFSASSVTVPAGGSASVTATITPATAPVNGQYGGYIVFRPRDDGQVYRVPFAGFVGDYQGITMLTAGPVPTVPMPWLAVLIDGTFFKVNGPLDWVFSLQGDDVPHFLVHLEHQAQLMEASIRNAATGALVHPVFNKAIDEALLPRNASSTGFFAFAWDGTRIHSNGYNGQGYDKDLTKPVSDGEYVVTIRLLKANGDAANPAHWETWTSPVIAIDRP
jgi:minor extracellular serine protease Vpr